MSVPTELLPTSTSASHPTVSPTGDRVAFYSNRSGRTELWLLAPATGELIQLSDGEVGVSRHAPLWASEGDRLFFDRAAGGDRETDIYSITLDGQVEKVTQLGEWRCVPVDLSPDNRHLLFTADKHGQWELRKYDFSKQKSDRVSEIVFSNQLAGFGPDGRRIAYPTATSEDQHYSALDTARGVVVSDADGSNERTLDVGKPSEGVVSRAWHSDGDRLFVTCTADRQSRHGLYDLSSDTVIWLGMSEVRETPIAYLSAHNALLVVRDYEFSSVPVVYPLDGEPTPLDVTDGVVSFPSSIAGPRVTLASGELIFVYSASDTPARLTGYDRSTDDHEVYFSDEEVNTTEEFVEATEVSYISEDGLEVSALLYDSGERPSPAVVRVKGGPDGRITKGFNPFVQALLRCGYTVIEPNYRGSDGRGSAFKELAFGNIGDGDAADVAAAARWLAGQDWIDEDRIAVYGHSHGAYLTYMVMGTYPSLWAAGITWNGYPDLLALEGHAAGHVSHLLGPREENEPLWRERSPIIHADNISAPILILHAENDWIPLWQAQRFRAALECRGWAEGDEFRFETLAEQGHHSRNPDQVRERWEHVLEFLDQHV